MLHTRCHAFRLQSLYVGHHHARSQIRVFAHIFKVAATQRRAVDVHAGSQYHSLSAIESLFAEVLAIQTRELRVPRSSQTGERRESHARVVGLVGLLPLVPQHVGAHSVRTVVGPEVREAQALHAGRREFGLSMNHGNLLVEGHAAQRIFYALLHGFALVEVNRHLLRLHCHSGSQGNSKKKSFHEYYGILCYINYAVIFFQMLWNVTPAALEHYSSCSGAFLQVLWNIIPKPLEQFWRKEPANRIPTPLPWGGGEGWSPST